LRLGLLDAVLASALVRDMRTPEQPRVLVSTCARAVRKYTRTWLLVFPLAREDRTYEPKC